MMKKALWLLVPALLVATACSSNSSSSAGTSSSSAATTDLTVFAASSLTAAFTQIGTDFEAANPGVHVTFNFGSSTDLAAQIASEGTADVFASASGTAMDSAAADPGVTDQADFATNQLVIITPTDNPANIASVDDLANDGVQVVLAAEGVPVGDYAREMLDNAGISKDVLANVVSNEPDDAAVVAKVSSGEADAGIVYTSDITTADVGSVTVPDDINVVATYPIAVVTGAPAGRHGRLVRGLCDRRAGGGDARHLRVRAAARLASMRRRLPLPILIAAVIGGAFVVLPVVALVARAPWGRFADVLGGVGARTALRLSLEVSLAATLLSVVFGVPLAWVLARREFRGRSVLRAMVVLPIVLPPVVAGVGLLEALGRRGVVGGWLDRAFGIQLTFSTAGAIVAATFVSMPLVVLATEAGFRGLDPRYEQAAGVLGASPGYALRRVVLPMVSPQLAAGAVLAWARALGEFGATITFAGNLQGRTQTVPLAVFQQLQTDRDGAVALSLVLVVISIAVLVALRERIMGAR